MRMDVAETVCSHTYVRLLSTYSPYTYARVYVVQRKILITHY